MILAVDAYYQNNNGLVAGVAFESWADAYPVEVYVTQIENVADYVPGQFYKRELPGILKLLSEHGLQPECLIVDGYVYLDGYSKPGLGKYLFDALRGNISVIGVAKKPFAGMSEENALFRGTSKKPLYITSVGIALPDAKLRILAMHGAHRIPTMLKKADQLCRSNVTKHSSD